MVETVMPPSPIDIFAPAACICFDEPDACVCPDTERALRHIARGAAQSLNPDQREWCLKEIERVEGYRREDYENESDRNLANGVMSAWVDYARDKGLM